jgi:hypothetical protein
VLEEPLEDEPPLTVTLDAPGLDSTTLRTMILR